MKNLIAFCGQAGAGKTTAANHLVSLGYTRMSFAAPLRDMLRCLGVSDYYLTEAKEIPCPALMGMTARKALQSLGTDWGRNMVDKDIWRHAASDRIRLALKRGERVVIDDCRFDNEAMAIRDLRGMVINLIRPGVGAKMSHESEAGINPLLVDSTIDAANPTDLYHALDVMLA